MGRRFIQVTIGLIILISAACLVSCSPATNTTSNSNRVFKVGVLNPAPVFQPVVDGFMEGMKELGYTEGNNLTLIKYDIKAESDLPAAAKSFVDQGVDLMLAVTNGAVEVALATTKTIPVAAGMVMHSVESGYAKSLAKPGGNYTGIDIGPATVARFQLLLEMFPQIKKVYIPIENGYAPTEIGLAAIEPIAKQANVELVEVRLKTPDEVQPAIDAVPKDVDAIFTLPDIFVSGALLPNWSAKAVELGIPHSHITRGGEGPLFSYGANLFLSGKQSAHLADQIFKGANPGELPIEIGKFYLIINLKTAQKIGYEVPESILKRADEIIRADS